MANVLAFLFQLLGVLVLGAVCILIAYVVAVLLVQGAKKLWEELKK